MAGRKAVEGVVGAERDDASVGYGFLIAALGACDVEVPSIHERLDGDGEQVAGQVGLVYIQDRATGAFAGGPLSLGAGRIRLRISFSRVALISVKSASRVGLSDGRAALSR
jgi:hypothetical protein